jgi:hypothetical protein
MATLIHYSWPRTGHILTTVMEKPEQISFLALRAKSRKRRRVRPSELVRGHRQPGVASQRLVPGVDDRAALVAREA